MKLKGIQIFIGTVCLVVVTSIIVSFFLVGSPNQQRAVSLDQQRVNDLQQISYAVDSFYNQVGSQKLPTSLEELRKAQNVYVNSIADPGTGAVYEYHPVDALDYQLCTTFETVMDTTGATKPASYVQGPGSAFWDHPVGHTCFDLKVNAALKPM